MAFSKVLKLLGYPEAYTLGTIPFLHAEIDLSYRPFIPRTETEFWVAEMIGKIQKERPGENLQILDIFSGSGAIGVAVAKELSRARVFFFEKNPRFVKQIQKNILLNAVSSNTIILPYQKQFPLMQFDYIFANPPYLTPKRPHHIALSVLLWEPFSALFAKNSGLFYIRKLIHESSALLKNGGALFIEHDPWQKDSIERESRKMGFSCVSYIDQYKNIRMSALIFKKNGSNTH